QINKISSAGENDLYNNKDRPVKDWVGLLEPTNTKVLAKYDHQYWGKYAAITENKYGKGKVFYVGSYLDRDTLSLLYEYILKNLGLWSIKQRQIFPIINKKLYNSKLNKNLDFYFNYSNKKQRISYTSNKKGVDLFSNKKVEVGQTFVLNPWDLSIILN
ncbi:beta-galactosidase trimerization domain-containing protein, partial [Bombilactobacillus bombi]|uniref:beta-galactosidase trimerization domain-containing protein n=1 Tax=Bombilactobacillus bombi TaxID=1303590 RepID=UPI0015E5C7D6